MKLHAIQGSTRCSCAAMGLDAAGLTYEFVIHSMEDLKANVVPVNPNGKVPTLETPEGPVFETNAILRHAARTAGKLYGANTYESALVDQWLDWTSSELGSLAGSFLYQLFGFEFPGLTYDKDVLFRSKAQFTSKLEIVNKALEGKTWIAGSEFSIADISLVNTVVHYLTFFAGDKERNKLANLTQWLETVSQQACFQKWFGKLRLCPGAQQFYKTESGPKAPAPKQEKKPKVVAEAPAPVKKEPKQSFPETTFNLFEFKNFFVNENDAQSAVDKFWTMYDPQGWSLWHLKYIKYPGECEEVYRTNNLLGGFLMRTQPLGKHLFGIHGIIGDEPNLKMEGVWLVQGLEIFKDLKEHEQFDCYTWEKLDHTNAEHKALLNDFWTARVEDQDKIHGDVLRTFKWVK